MVVFLKDHNKSNRRMGDIIPAIQSTARPWMPSLPMPVLISLMVYPPPVLVL